MASIATILSLVVGVVALIHPGGISFGIGTAGATPPGTAIPPTAQSASPVSSGVSTQDLTADPSRGSVQGQTPTGPGRVVPVHGPPPGQALPPIKVAPPTLRVTTASLPSGAVGAAWTATFAATGGTSPYRWSVAGGTLPRGFVLLASGQLNGQGRSPGSSLFTITVTDVAGMADSRQFTILVAPALADLNGDGSIDCADYAILHTQWGQQGTGLSGDLNHDGVVDITDGSIMFSHWTGSATTCS